MTSILDDTVAAAESGRSTPATLCRMTVSGCENLLDIAGRGSHSSTFRLNLSAFCGIGLHLGVVEGVFERCQGVFRSIRGCSGCILC